MGVYDKRMNTIKNTLLLTCLLLGLTIASTANARPVSYPEGWTFMTMNDGDNNSTHIHYSPTAKYSVGWRHEYFRDSKANADSAQLNYLIKRWNTSTSQANLYIKSGAGVIYDDGETDAAVFTGIAADWETRRWFTSYENRAFKGGDINSFVNHKARVGVAPYLGDYGDIHTWLMLQADYDAGERDSFSVTPLVRFFKGATMLEAGYNIGQKTPLFNFVYRY